MFACGRVCSRLFTGIRVCSRLLVCVVLARDSWRFFGLVRACRDGLRLFAFVRFLFFCSRLFVLGPARSHLSAFVRAVSCLFAFVRVCSRLFVFFCVRLFGLVCLGLLTLDGFASRLFVWLFVRR